MVVSDAAISTHRKSMLFHSHAANTLAFLLTIMNLFIYLNQITDKIKTGIWKFLCCDALSKPAFI